MAENLDLGHSTDNVELAHVVLNTLGVPDAERLIELTDPEVEWHSFFGLSPIGVYRGHDSMRQYMRDLNNAFEHVAAEADDALAIADIAVLVGRMRYRGQGSDGESTSPAGWVLKFRDGKVLSFRAFREPAQALEAVGVVDG